MLRMTIAAALVAAGALLGASGRVEAASADCRVYAASPDFVAGTLQTIPCGPTGLLVTNGSPTTDQEVVGNVANDAVDSGNPVKMGGYASSTVPASVGVGDRVNAWFSLYGAQSVSIASGAGGVGADNSNQGSLFSPGNSALQNPLGAASYIFDGTSWDRWQGNNIAATTGGCTPAKTLSAASTNSTSVKGSAGTLCSLTVINTTATLYYLKLYDKATAPTCNSDTVIQTIPVPASTAGAGVSVDVGPYGWAFTLGIGLCLTGALADNDNTNAATGVAISYSYK